MNTLVCVLSRQETGQIENYGIWPKCKHHKHVKLKKAATLVATDMYRSVGGEHTAVKTPVSMITECTNNTYVWANRPSGGPLGVVTKQFIPING